MSYKGVIKKSRTLDLTMISQMLDVATIAFLAYEPEQLGLPVVAYFGVRVVINVAQVYLRFKTTGPVGDK